MRETSYARDLADLERLLAGEPDPVARMATIAALLKERHPKISWAGFYRLGDGDVLVLGPFQGSVACLRIRKGEGVCGASAARNEPVLVPDVRGFPGHIACDPEARSELVLPVRDVEGRLRGVLDLDSRELGAFGEEDREGLLPIAGLVFAHAPGSRSFDA